MRFNRLNSIRQNYVIRDAAKYITQLLLWTKLCVLYAVYSRPSLIIITQFLVHDAALLVQLPDAPTSLYPNMPIQESLLDIHERFMATQKPGLRTTVS